MNGITKKRIAAALAAAACSLAAGCGGDDSSGGEDADAIRTTLAAPEDGAPAKRCSDVFTPAFVARSFEGGRCPEFDADDSVFDDASDIDVSGDRATLNVKLGLEGRQEEPPTGVTMVRSGERWRVDAVDIRPLLGALVTELPEGEGEEANPLATLYMVDGMTDCLAGEVRKLDDTAATRMFRLLVGGRGEQVGRETIRMVIGPCMRRVPAAPRAARAVLEDAFADRAGPLAECLVRGLRTRVTDDDYVEAFIAQIRGTAASTKLIREAQAVRRTCQASG